MGPEKAEKKCWRTIKIEKRKRKEEKLSKQLLAAAKEQVKRTDEKSEATVNEIRTISIVVPSSILENAQSQELQGYLAGQIARAACIYKVNEIIVLDDERSSNTAGIDEIQPGKKNCTKFVRLLQYLECPQYLRKFFFPLHKHLKYAGLMNPLDAPHHLRQDEESEYREGITTQNPVRDERKGTFVNVGLLRDVFIDKTLTPGLRVTVKLIPAEKPHQKKIRGIVVSPTVPQASLGIYWGYSVRIAHTLTEVFSKCPYQGGYDLTIGTSDKGENIDKIADKKLLNYKHCLIGFGGLQGLEAVLDNDDDVHVDHVSLMFDHYINTCPNQGSRTIRTEEAILISLAEFRKKLFVDK